MRFRRVPVRRVPGQKADEVQRVLVQMADEVPEGSGADGQKPPKIFQAVGDNT